MKANFLGTAELQGTGNATCTRISSRCSRAVTVKKNLLRLRFSLPLPSSLLKLPTDVPQPPPASRIAPLYKQI